MGITAGVLHEKFYANRMKHRVFERFDIFSTKYGHDSSMFCQRMAVFLQNMGMKAMIFS